MAFDVSQDFDRKIRVSNRWALEHKEAYENSGLWHYCNTPGCTAHMRPRFLKIGRFTRVIWAATPNHPHTDGVCLYGFPQFAKFDHKAFTLKGFDIMHWFGNVEDKDNHNVRGGGAGTSGDGPVGLRLPYSLKDVYFLCKMMSKSAWIDSRLIKNVLIDNRSILDHDPNELTGKHIGEFRFWKYDKSSASKQLHLLIWGMRHSPVEVVLHFDDDELFFKTLKKIFCNRKESKHAIIAAGTWERGSSVHQYSIKILSPKQIHILTKR